MNMLAPTLPREFVTTVAEPRRVPGPESARMLAEQALIESNAISYPRRIPLAISSASGPYVQDVDGHTYIDFLMGAGSLPLGHSHPRLVAAAAEQLAHHCHGLDFPTAAKQAFLRGQLSMLPEAMQDKMKIHTCGPTGADANEAAIKLCKHATGRTEVISFRGGYHGCTQGTLALAGDRQMKQFAGANVASANMFPYSYCYRCPLGLERSSCRSACAGLLESAFSDTHSGLGNVACVVMELVQGEGGVVVADREFVRRVREVTARHGVPLVIDEVQSGCGRTGTWFAFEQFDIEPDVVCVSKAVSGIGLPLAFILYQRELDTWPGGAHIGTFRGNQAAFAAGSAYLEVVEQDQLLANVAARGRQAMDRLREIKEEHPIVGEVRGLGLMLGLELCDPATGAQSGALASAVQRACLERGLIVEVGGRADSVVRLLPPLNVTPAVLHAALDALEDAVDAVVDQRGAA